MKRNKFKKMYSFFITQIYDYCLLTDCEQTIIFSSYFLVFLNFQIRNYTEKDEIVLFSSALQFLNLFSLKLYFSVNKNNSISPSFIRSILITKKEVFEIIIV